jgi:hypothetical protein
MSGTCQIVIVYSRRTTEELSDGTLPLHTMPSCQNCGGFVTEQYVRVFAPDGFEEPRVCPNCEDKLREKGEIREARSKRA